MDHASQPFFDSASGLWLYGNVTLLRTPRANVLSNFSSASLALAEAERLIFDGFTLVCGMSTAVQQEVALVPLIWGSPRILIVEQGFHYHFGENLLNEPFAKASLYRARWDSLIDLAVSKAAPNEIHRSRVRLSQLVKKLTLGQFQISRR